MTISNMLQQLLDDIRGYFESKPSLSEEEKSLLNRLKEDVFPILFLQREDLARTAFDESHITTDQMRRLAKEMESEYCKNEYWDRLEVKADYLGLPRTSACPHCDHYSSIDIGSGSFRCEICDRTWRKDLYVLVEFPDDISYFEQNEIGYPSFESRDNGARYVSEYDYIEHFKKNPAPSSYFKPLCWPKSQSYLPDDNYDGDPAGDSIRALNECINDEKGIGDFGEQAVWVPLCNLKN